MISQLMEQLIRFRTEAREVDFKRIFGQTGLHLWDKYKDFYEFDLVKFYTSLDAANRRLFEAHLAAQLPPTCRLAEPRCAECGGELAESDIEAGEDVCLDCAAALMLERDAEASGADAEGIEYEPGSLLATVRVRLEGEELEERERREWDRDAGGRR